MKRHIGLQPLSHDHHAGLVHALRMTKAAEGLRDPVAVTEEYLAFQAIELVRHFREEEDALVPMLPERDEQRVRLVREHRQLEALTLALKAARESGADLRPTLATLGDLLEKHIRFEERELFPRLESILTDEELMALAPLFAGGPKCSG